MKPISRWASCVLRSSSHVLRFVHALPVTTKACSMVGLAIAVQGVVKQGLRGDIGGSGA